MSTQAVHASVIYTSIHQYTQVQVPIRELSVRNRESFYLFIGNHTRRTQENSQFCINSNNAYCNRPHKFHLSQPPLITTGIIHSRTSAVAFISRIPSFSRNVHRAIILSTSQSFSHDQKITLKSSFVAHNRRLFQTGNLASEVNE